MVGAHRKNPSTIMPATFQGVADKCYDQYFTLGKLNHLVTDQVRQYDSMSLDFAYSGTNSAVMKDCKICDVL